MSSKNIFGANYDAEINLNINSIFEMLPENGRIVVLSDRDKDRTWPTGKRVTVADVVGDEFFTLDINHLTYAIGVWEDKNDKDYDAMALTEQEAIDILRLATKWKKKQ
jgi:hypothetical protein